jgi:hypothetical protein
MNMQTLSECDKFLMLGTSVSLHLDWMISAEFHWSNIDDTKRDKKSVMRQLIKA